MSRNRKRTKTDDPTGTPPDGESFAEPPPPKQPRSLIAAVTPAPQRTNEEHHAATSSVSRTLFPEDGTTVVVTPARNQRTPPSPVKRKLIFGKSVVEITVQENVRRVYAIIKKRTGSIGGNGSFGPIYGELTMGSMQKMINLMKEHTEFSAKSRFIDVGSGVGKPNLHVAQDPGVEFSYGIELEADRWLLSMHGLQGTLSAMGESQDHMEEPDKLKGRCVFVRGDISDAHTFNPFTHVYMFSIGFPPTLWCTLADIWNRSSSTYLICFHGPKDIIKEYEFQVELLVQTPTSMHGSKEGHMGYIYKRNPIEGEAEEVESDPYFEPSWDLIKSGFDAVKKHVDEELDDKMKSQTGTRSRRSSPQLEGQP